MPEVLHQGRAHVQQMSNRFALTAELAYRLALLPFFLYAYTPPPARCEQESALHHRSK